MAVSVDVQTSFARFRRFVIDMTCRDRLPRKYLTDLSVVVEREPDVFKATRAGGLEVVKKGTGGQIYAIATDMVTVRAFEELSLKRVTGIVSYTYNSKSGRTNLRWEVGRNGSGRLRGRASGNSILYLVTGGILTREQASSDMSNVEVPVLRG